MSAPLIDRAGIAAKHKLPYRYVRDTLTKKPDFPAPAVRVTRILVRWNAYEVEKYLLRTARK